MKDYLIIFLCGSLPLTGYTQKVHQEDSLRILELPDVQVTSRWKGQSGQLFSFFRANPAATTEDLLARLPELSLIRRGSYGMEPVIRAYNSNQVTVLVDGMRINGACTDKMDPVSIYLEPQNLQAIDVKTSGSSLMQGASVGGSINLKLSEAACHEETRFSGSFNSGYHTAAESFYEALNLHYATSTWGLKATGTYRKSHNYRDGSGATVPYSQYEKANISLNGKWVLRKDLSLKTDFLADDGWNIGYPALPMDAGYAAARIGAVSLVRENHLRRWKRMEAKVYANRIRHYMDDTRRPDVPMHMDMPGKSFTSGLFVEGECRSRPGRSLQVRGDASVTHLTASMTMYAEGQPPMYMLTWPDNRQLQTGLAATGDYLPDSSTQVRWSVRGDVSRYSLATTQGADQLEVFGYRDTDQVYVLPSGTLQVSRKVMPRLSASLAVSLSGRTPTASERYGFYLFSAFDGYDYIGNPDLQQEWASQAELTVRWQEPKVKFQVSGYTSRVNNYIIGALSGGMSAMTLGAKGVKVYRNIPYATLRGGEASAVYSPLRRTQVVATLRYAYGRDNGGAPLPLIAPLRSISSVRQQAGRFWLQAEWEAAGTQHRVSAAAGEKATKGFSLWHLRAGYGPKDKREGWSLSAGVENLLDAYYREHLDWGGVARPGRNGFVQVSWSF